MKRALHRNLPSMESLVVLAAVAQAGNFAMAGEQLGLTQSGVSRQISDLEQFLGTKLMQRGRGGFQLTATGQRYLNSISPPLLDIEFATRQAQLQLPVSRSIELQVTTSYCNMWLIKRLPQLFAQHPQFLINISSRIGYHDLRKERHDAAIALMQQPPTELMAHKLMHVHLSPFASPELLNAQRIRLPKGQGLPVEKLLCLPLLHLQQSPNDWHSFANLASCPGARIERSISNSLLQMNYQAALAGLGVALLPPAWILEDVRVGRLVRLSALELDAQRHLYLLHHHDAAVVEKIHPLIHWLLKEHAVTE
jgi:LysR family transcriptional regulator, glycine cleavage system transcriptional activator